MASQWSVKKKKEKSFYKDFVYMIQANRTGNGTTAPSEQCMVWLRSWNKNGISPIVPSPALRKTLKRLS